MAHGLSCSEACGVSGSGIEPVSLALAGGFFTIEPPGKPCVRVLMRTYVFISLRHILRSGIVGSYVKDV